MTKNAQEWLNTTYQDKKVNKIGLYEKNKEAGEELIDELIIEGYTKVEEIDFRRWGKKIKDKITKLTIINCPQLKRVYFNNNEIAEVVFDKDCLNLTWLDFPDNKLTKIDVSKIPNLTRLNVARNPSLIEVEGLENLTKLESINLLDTPGLNGKKFKKWKEKINDAVGSAKDDPLPDDWEGKLNDLKERPTKDDLTKAVDAKTNEFKGYINPADLKDKDKIEQIAKDNGFELEKHKEGDLKPTDYDSIKEELEKWKKEFGDKKPSDIAGQLTRLENRPDIPINKDEWDDDYSKRPKKSDFEELQAQLNKVKGLLGLNNSDSLPSGWESKLVKKGDLDNANNKVKDYENGLKDKLGLNDSNLSTWKDEIDKLKKRPTSNQINAILGLNPNDPLPSNWQDKLVSKDKLDEWTNKFPNKSAQQVDTELQAKPAAGGSGSGVTLNSEQQEKLNKYDKLRKWADEEEKVIELAEDILSDTGEMRDNLKAYIEQVAKMKI